MAAVPAAGRTEELAQLLADAEAWNAYAVRMNAKAIASGLVTAEEIERSQQASQAALADLLARMVRP